MPPDPIVEAQKARELAIKQEMEEAERLRIKGKGVFIFWILKDSPKVLQIFFCFWNFILLIVFLKIDIKHKKS